MTPPLTKTLDPGDFDLLPKELAIVDEYFTFAREQHPMRRWEYALALHAILRWAGQAGKVSYRAIDVGGGGSPFRRMLQAVRQSRDVIVVDPSENYDLAAYVADFPRLSPVVTCLSVLEHVEDLDHFLYHLNCLVAPGGLLFLTMDCREDDADLAQRVGDWCWPTDDRHFHWMRTRIFTPRMILTAVSDTMVYLGFHAFGVTDLPVYHGNHVYDYSFASLALLKRS